MAIYLKKFSTHAEYEAYIASEDKVLPNVSICTTEGDVHYTPEPPHDYSQDYFTMVITSGGDIKWSGSTTANTLSYSMDNGTTWTTANSSTTISVSSGDKVLWKGTPTPQKNNGIGKFSGDTNARYSVEGNAMSLLFGDEFEGQTSLSDKSYALSRLFSGNTNLTSAENLSLPATTLVDYCYRAMFYNCTSLTTAPSVLPATTLANYCYQIMFYGCTSLTTAPELPATTLRYQCYNQMFLNCTSLTTAPELPATTLTTQCYQEMFYNTNVLPDCTNIDFSSQSVVASGGLVGLFAGTKLTDAQLDAILKEHGINNYSLPVTTLADYCYSFMFNGCTNLTTAPELPATTLATQCYNQMFQNCTSLTTAPSELPATTLTSKCYYQMFQGCTNLTTAPELPATTLADSCYRYMFEGCTSLSSIKCLATNISASSCTGSWVNGVASSGTFTKAASMSSWTTGASGIPSGWTVVDAA